MNRPIQNPLGMAPDPLRHIAYTQSGTWWDDRDMKHMQETSHDVITVEQSATDEDVDALVKFRLAKIHHN